VNIDRHNYWNAAGTDREGRITFPALIPGAIYQMGTFKGRWNLHKQFSVRSGETLDLGNVTMVDSR
jgi:hypothetical protein